MTAVSRFLVLCGRRLTWHMSGSHARRWHVPGSSSAVVAVRLGSVVGEQFGDAADEVAVDAPEDILDSVGRGVTTFVNVSNHFEGSALLTMSRPKSGPRMRWCRPVTPWAHVRALSLQTRTTR